MTTVGCSTKYTAVHNSGKRDMSHVSLVVIHCTEGDTAEAAARWFTNPASGGSTQLVVDDTSCFRTLPDNVIPWGAANANGQGLHIEQAGHASWSKAKWMLHFRTIRRAARAAALWCHTYHIPVHFLSPDELAKGAHGITSHAHVSLWSAKAGLSGDHSHTDPGPNYPYSYFMHCTRIYYKRLGR